jgi:hypothetical protein
MAYKRFQVSVLQERIHEPRHTIQVITGPRQVGKTTLVNQVLEECALPFSSYSADDVPGVNGDWLSMVWDSQRRLMTANDEAERLLVIDEVQKIFNWSEVVKAEWDRDTREGRELKVVLLGSSRMWLERGLTESLAGRFELIRVSQWTYAEMKACFGWNLYQYMYFGGYPGAARYIHDENRWRDYVRNALIEPAISKDILMGTPILKPQLFRQLFEIGSSYSSQLLSLTKVASQLQDAGNVTTLAGYLHLQEQAGLLCGLQKYAQDTARKYNSVPKFQVFDNALFNVYKDYTLAQAMESPELWGRLVESAVGAYLVNQSWLCNFNVYYWRDKNDEVDFVIVKYMRTVAIEVKSGRRTMNVGLSKFRDLFHPHATLVVGSGGFTLEEFLQTDLNKLFR